MTQSPSAVVPDVEDGGCGTTTTTTAGAAAASLVGQELSVYGLQVGGHTRFVKPQNSPFLVIILH